MEQLSQFYAYAKKGPDWLSTQVILSYFKALINISNIGKKFKNMQSKRSDFWRIFTMV
jgi:hypothetical protein